MTGSLQSQPGAGITGHDAHAGRPRLVNRFEATKVVVEIAANDRRQPSHEADVVLQPFHVEPLPSANFFGAGLPLHAVVEIAANDHRQPPHEADVMLQAFHVEPVPTANFFGAGLALHTKMAADLPFEIAANDRMQSPHEADRWLQAFHKEGLRPANFSIFFVTGFLWSFLVCVCCGASRCECDQE